VASKRRNKTSNKSRKKRAIPYLKNAWVRQDEDGYYYLYICAKDGNSAILNLTALNPSIDEHIKNEINPERQPDIVKSVLESWLAEQESPSGKSKKSDDAEVEFPELIDD
jgi:hypothetical protein